MRPTWALCACSPSICPSFTRSPRTTSGGGEASPNGETSSGQGRSSGALPNFLAAADLAVVPLEYGGGTRMKILEYFATGLPVLSTPKGAEGIPAESGREIVLAPLDDFSSIIGALMDDPGRRQRIGELGRELVRRYDWLEV